jgi:hypothetical protein
MLKQTIKYFFLLILVLFAYKALASFSDSPAELGSFDSLPKKVLINDNGLTFSCWSTAATVEGLLNDHRISVSEHDAIVPAPSTKLLPGAQVEIHRAVKVKIEIDGKTIEDTFGKTIADALIEEGVTLSRLDKTSPALSSPCQTEQKIVVTRINEEIKTIPEDIDFKTITKTDSKMGWREKKVEQPGEKGIKEVTYKIIYKNGKEISRDIIEKKIAKEPQPETVIQGTYVKLGKTHRGLGTWYAFKGGLYAASPWLPIGSFAKVTNKATGKSVIVEINDRGPFGENRIIDLDKVAFQKIASLGAGVVDVKVEEVLN